VHANAAASKPACGARQAARGLLQCTSCLESHERTMLEGAVISGARDYSPVTMIGCQHHYTASCCPSTLRVVAYSGATHSRNCCPLQVHYDGARCLRTVLGLAAQVLPPMAQRRFAAASAALSQAFVCNGYDQEPHSKLLVSWELNSNIYIIYICTV
jgi:hypothetical protein